MALASPCKIRSCPEPAVKHGWCVKHYQEAEKNRGTAADRGYDRRWRKARAAWLKKQPLCVECGRRGIVRPATVVDHKTPHRGDMEKFWDQNNWQSLCKDCHDRKTMAEIRGRGG